MKISEILTELTRYDRQYEVESRLSDAGYTHIGSGASANVYTKPDIDYVIKIFDSKDTGYLRFLDLIQKVENVHFPVIRGKPMLINSNTYGVKLEKLTPFVYEGYYRSLLTYINYFVNEIVYDYKSTNANYLYSKENTLRLTPEKINHMNILYDNMAEKWKKFEQQFPELSTAIKLIVKYVLIPLDGRADLHNYNVMMRGKTLVIIDPIWSTTDIPDQQIPSSPSQLPLKLDMKKINKPDLNEPESDELHYEDINSQDDLPGI